MKQLVNDTVLTTVTTFTNKENVTYLSGFYAVTFTTSPTHLITQQFFLTKTGQISFDLSWTETMKDKNDNCD